MDVVVCVGQLKFRYVVHDNETKVVFSYGSYRTIRRERRDVCSMGEWRYPTL